jgi:drug/metabolite transporter (DMT)-like permease
MKAVSSESSEPTPIEFMLLLLLGILWGIPYALTKLALTTIPPITFVSARVSIAAAVLWLVVMCSRCAIPRDRGVLASLFLQGGLACILPYTLIAFGQKSVGSALAAILNSTTPLFVCLVGLLGSQYERLTPSRVLGVTIGLSGVILIVGADALGGLNSVNIGQGAIVLATLVSACSVIYGRRFSAIRPEVSAAVTLTSAAIVLLPLSFMAERPLTVTPSLSSLAALGVSACLSTALAFVIYFRLIRTIGSMGTASVGYLKPAVGVLVGCTLLGESFNLHVSLGLAAILVGVAAINHKNVAGHLNLARRIQKLRIGFAKPA